MLQDKCPPMLFISGNINLLNSISVGFCGSRKASAKGIGIAADCSRQLIKENIKQTYFIASKAFTFAVSALERMVK